MPNRQASATADNKVECFTKCSQCYLRDRAWLRSIYERDRFAKSAHILDLPQCSGDRVRMRRLALSLLFLLSALSCGPATAKPALWKLADADTTIWLFGSIHILPEGQQWRDAELDGAIAGSRGLVLEAVLDRDPGEVARLLFSMGRTTGLPPIAERVPPAKRQRLTAMIAKSGIPAATYDQLKSWAAAFLLTGVAVREIGEDKAIGAGVEPQLSEQFRSAGKPIEGLETAAEQLGYFDAMPESAQRAFLGATLDDTATARTDFHELISAWQHGDAAAIERAFADDPEFTPAVRDMLIRRRDRAWADKLAARLAEPGAIFVAVGAGHLVGPDSVQKMLAAKGLKVVRVR